jgi:adenylate cyclase
MTSVLKKMFGRYLSTEVMNSLIDNPSALELGGERRTVTIMMTDLRGFTAISERLEPERVVQTLNAYFEVMVHFTATRPEVDAYFQAHRRYA